MLKHNAPSLKIRRQELRSTMTPAEIRLWQAIKQRQFNGLKFRRQHSVGPYIVDFYCPSAKLVIELDGAVHDSESAWQYDEHRTASITSLGLRVLRFENRAVMENLDGVLNLIREHIEG
ncbi:MAG: endonuclease domain-containing protein [Candidatus Contendobacter sp.]